MFEHPVYGLTYRLELESGPPTPEEIKQRAAEIRSRWSKAQEAKRREGIQHAIPYELKSVSLKECSFAN